jgi:hypothetical protein
LSNRAFCFWRPFFGQSSCKTPLTLMRQHPSETTGPQTIAYGWSLALATLAIPCLWLK